MKKSLKVPHEMGAWLGALAMVGVFAWVAWPSENPRLLALGMLCAIVFFPLTFFSKQRQYYAVAVMFIAAGWIAIFPPTHTPIASIVILFALAPLMALYKTGTSEEMPYWLRMIWLMPIASASFPLWFFAWRLRQKSRPRHATRVVPR